MESLAVALLGAAKEAGLRFGVSASSFLGVICCDLFSILTSWLDMLRLGVGEEITG